MSGRIEEVEDRVRERRHTVLAGVESARGPVLQSDREGTPWPS